MQTFRHPVQHQRNNKRHICFHATSRAIQSYKVISSVKTATKCKYSTTPGQVQQSTITVTTSLSATFCGLRQPLRIDLPCTDLPRRSLASLVHIPWLSDMAKCTRDAITLLHALNEASSMEYLPRMLQGGAKCETECSNLGEFAQLHVGKRVKDRRISWN